MLNIQKTFRSYQNNKRDIDEKKFDKKKAAEDFWKNFTF